MLDYNRIIDKYVDPAIELHSVLITHSSAVAELACTFAERLIERGEAVDTDFVYEAAMLHDIGVCRVSAPNIHCHGTEPYIMHGIIGAEILLAEHLPRHARVSECHIGTGITRDDVLTQHLPIPARDYLPITVEEMLVCYADKFFSKNHLGEPPRSIEVMREKLQRFGPASIQRLDAMVERFGLP